MGWFDNEQEEGRPTAAAPQSAPPRSAAKAPAPETGSTLGRELHVDGTIVCDEDLTILGRVDGTIRAKGTLVIAKGADVRAKIDGQRVMVHGKVNGNVQGAERVVLGQTGDLTGNIETPTLEIIEGARFKGSVEMPPAKPAPATKPVVAASRKPKSEKEQSGDEDAANARPVRSDGAEESAAAQKQATP
jgi:cytoskeletal protein CcmA (bactofilin family)